MKRYQVICMELNVYQIINLDEKPIIKEIILGCGLLDDKSNLHLTDIQLEFILETPKMKQQFAKIPGVYEQRLGFEGINLNGMKDRILKTLKFIQKLDPIPPEAFIELQKTANIDLSLILMLLENNYEGALQLALAENEAGNFDSIVSLADFYEKNCEVFTPLQTSEEQKEEQSSEEIEPLWTEESLTSSTDLDRFIEVLEHIPNNNPHYIKANERLHYALLVKEVPIDETEHYYLLEKKFRAAFNAHEFKVADHYFDELCGNSGMQPAIKDLKGEADTLIRLASIIRSQTKKINNAASAENKVNRSQGFWKAESTKFESDEDSPDNTPQLD